MELINTKHYGIAGRPEIVLFRKKFMRKENVRTGSHNHLFGTAYNQKIGLCTDSNFSDRNNNIILTGNVKEEEYLLPNLFSAHSSAVVLDFTLHILSNDRYIEVLKSKGNILDVRYPEEITENIIRQLTEKQTYLFTDSVETIGLLIQRLYRYAEHQTILCPVQFYLRETDTCCLYQIFQKSDYPSENFSSVLAADRKYRTGFTIFSESMKSLKQSCPDGEYKNLLDSCDTKLFFSADTEEDKKMIDKLAGSISTDSKENPNKIKRIFRTAKGSGINITAAKMKILSPEVQKPIFESGKFLVFVRDTVPMICSKLNIRKIK